MENRMADITVVISALKDGLHARREIWRQGTSIFLEKVNGQPYLFKRGGNKNFPGAQDHHDVLWWDDLIANDWEVVEPTTIHPQT
jgi:hypothetical protein